MDRWNHLSYLSKACRSYNSTNIGFFLCFHSLLGTHLTSFYIIECVSLIYIVVILLTRYSDCCTIGWFNQQSNRRHPHLRSPSRPRARTTRARAPRSPLSTIVPTAFLTACWLWRAISLPAAPTASSRLATTQQYFLSTLKPSSAWRTFGGNRWEMGGLHRS